MYSLRFSILKEKIGKVVTFFSNSVFIVVAEENNYKPN